MTTSKEFAENTQALAKLKFSLDKRNLTSEAFRVLQETVWPDADERSVLLAIDYCRARNLDPFKRPVHIVPVYSKKAGGMVFTIWPGISEIRTTATRTKTYAGKDETIFGPKVVENFGSGDEVLEVNFPEWAQITVYRVVEGLRCAFVGPKVYWKETYATASRNTTKPNKMWAQRPIGQLDKCAEAAALRVAFPEELGNEYAAEEMEGKVVDTVDGEWKSVDLTPPGEPGESPSGGDSDGGFVQPPEASFVQPPEASEDKKPEEEKTKRTRRTKAQIEADKKKAESPITKMQVLNIENWAKEKAVGGMEKVKSWMEENYHGVELGQLSEAEGEEVFAHVRRVAEGETGEIV